MYAPHFYFAVHFHAFAFVMLALFEVAGMLHWRWLFVVRSLLLLLPIIYLGVALRTVYGGGRLLTAAKTVAIIVIDLLFVVMTMAGIAVLTLQKFK